jgi:hypothetical protein
VLDFSRQYGTPVVSLSRESAGGKEGSPAGESTSRWTSYVRVADLRVQGKNLVACRRPMPQIPFHATKLEALSTLHDHAAAFGAVVDDSGQVLGTISQRGLVEQLFRPHLRGRDHSPLE